MLVLWTYVYNVLWFLWKLSLLHIIWLNWNQSLSFSLMNSCSFCPSTRKRNMMQLCVSDVSSNYLNFLQVFISRWLQLCLNKVQWPYRSLSIGVGFTKTMIFYSLSASTFLELIEIKSTEPSASLVAQTTESTCQWRRHGFEPWSGKISFMPRST